MVSDNAVGGVNTIDVLCTELAGIWTCPTKLLDLHHDWVKDVCIIVGQLVLDDRDDTFEAHASVYMFRRERFQRTVLLTVELDEDVIPDFNDCRIISINKMWNLTIAYSIDVYLAAKVVDMGESA